MTFNECSEIVFTVNIDAENVYSCVSNINICDCLFNSAEYLT